MRRLDLLRLGWLGARAVWNALLPTTRAVSPVVPSDLVGLLIPGGGSDQPVPMRPDDYFSARALVDPSRLIAGRLFYPYNPSALVTRKGLAIYDLMKADEQVKVCLAFVKNAVLSAGWEVVSPDGEDADWEVTRFVRDAFLHLPGGADDALRKVMMGIDYGYSCVEKVFGDVDWAPGKKGIVAFTALKPHYVDIQQGPQGQVLGIIQRYAPGAGQPPGWGESGARAVPAWPPEKFVLYAHDIEFENHYGRSALESAYRAWWVKDNAYKWFAVMLERYGMPPLFVMYDPDKYAGAQLTELRKVIIAIKNATFGLLPRKQKESLEFWSAELASQSKDVFLAALGRFDADIAAALLIPSLLGTAGGGEQLAGGRGSYARANVHFKNFLNMIRATQKNIASRAINPQLVRQLCDLNFAGLKSYPEFKFLDPDDETETELFKMWADLVDKQVVNRLPDDENHIRKALNFPENANPVVEPLAPKATPGQPAGGMGGADVEPIPQESLSEEMRAFAEANNGAWVSVAGHPLCLRREAVRAA